MKSITLDFSDCKYCSDIYKIIKKGFLLPEYYGENLDALYDSLDCYCSYKIHIFIRGLDKVPKALDFEANEILKVFDEISENNPNMKFEILL